jgi:L-lactate dehydrogenase (cytochrome)
MKELLGTNPFKKLPYLPDLLTHPAWAVSFLLDGGVPNLKNVVLPGKGPMPLTDVASALSRAVVTWNDLSWIRRVWDGPIVVKGVLTADDARRAVDHGAAAIVVSNHGGRQLDGVDATIRALPQIVAAVNRQIEVLVDGGIRRGSDVVKALGLGAEAVLIGRAYAYGLAVAGRGGVLRAIEIIRSDIERTLRLLGCGSVKDLDASFVRVPKEWTKC